MQKHPKNLLVIISLIIVMVAGAYYLARMDSPSQNANPLIYQNSKYHFALDLPKGWDYLALPNQIYKNHILSLVNFYDRPFNVDDDGSSADLIFITTDADPLNWQDYQSENFKIFQKTDFLLGSYPATKLVGFSLNQNEQEIIVVCKVNLLYYLVIGRDTAAAKTNFDQILTTFKIQPS